MNTDTGELKRLAIVGGPGKGITAATREALLAGFKPVPKEHEAEAMQIINIAEEEQKLAFADMSTPTPLVNWAKSQQKKKKNKNRSKMAKKEQAEESIIMKKSYGPRHLRRSVAKANITRLGFSHHHTNFKGIWRDFAIVPSEKDIADMNRQRAKDAKRRKKEREKAPA